MTSEEHSDGLEESTAERPDGPDSALQPQAAESDGGDNRPPASRASQVVAEWWADHMPGSVLGHHMDAYNHVQGKLADLVARLERN